MSDAVQIALAGLIAAAIGQLVTWATTRNKDRGAIQISQAELEEKSRSGDLDLIIKTLQSELTRALGRLTSLEIENRECWADREQLHRQLSKLQAKVDGMGSGD